MKFNLKYDNVEDPDTYLSAQISNMGNIQGGEFCTMSSNK